jgi:glutathione S-transferase
MYGMCRPGQGSGNRGLGMSRHAAPLLLSCSGAGPCGALRKQSGKHLENTMIKLYGGPRTRAGVVYWYLEELGLPYEAVPVNIQLGAQHRPEYRALNPIGKVPAMEDGDTKVWESGAILLYLGEKYGNTPKTLEGRTQMSCWVVYANATLTPAIFAERNRLQEVMRVVEPLNDVLSGKQFLLGDELTVADIAVGAMVGWSSMAFRMDYSSLPNVMGYIRRLGQRPAYQKTIVRAA